MSKEIEELEAIIAEEAEKNKELARRKQALFEKKLDLEEKRVDISFENLMRGKEETEKSENVKFGKMSPEAIEKLLRDNSEYLEAAKNPIPFICSEFDSIVPFFRKNLIMICAPSGKGKSTCVANVVNTAMKHTNPLTGKPYRICILTNEEAPEDFFNRLCCFSKGWEYSNHDRFNDEQRYAFSKSIKYFTESGQVTVIGDVYEGVSGWTTSVEGVVKIFDNLIRDEEEYDIILLDYYQNVVRSREQPELNEYQAQRLLSHEMDRIKNIYPGVIVVMAQIEDLKDEDDQTPYSIRLKGTKLIITKCTFICEIVPEYELFRSTWVVRKSRFTGSNGKKVITGFDRGRYVPYSTKFQQEISSRVLQRQVDKKEQDLPPGLHLVKEEPKDET